MAKDFNLYSHFSTILGWEKEICAGDTWDNKLDEAGKKTKTMYIWLSEMQNKSWEPVTRHSEANVYSLCFVYASFTGFCRDPYLLFECEPRKFWQMPACSCCLFCHMNSFSWKFWGKKDRHIVKWYKLNSTIASFRIPLEHQMSRQT